MNADMQWTSTTQDGKRACLLMCPSTFRDDIQFCRGLVGPVAVIVPDPITFVVYGRPQQRGSKRPVRLKDGRTVLMDANAKSVPWMSAVSHAAATAMGGQPLITDAVEMRLSFHFARPKAHYRTGKYAGLLRDDAPAFHAVTPDIDKLQRAVSDALTGIVYVDDRLVALAICSKEWTATQERLEAKVRARPLRGEA